jgi:arylsulfatase
MTHLGHRRSYFCQLLQPVITEFGKSIVDFPNIKRVAGGASNDPIPNLSKPRKSCALYGFKNRTEPWGMED